MDLTTFLDAANFATVGGGVLFVTVFLIALRRSLTLAPIQTLAAQAVLTLTWATVATLLFMTGPLVARLANVVVMAVVVMAIQTGAYEWIKGFQLASPLAVTPAERIVAALPPPVVVATTDTTSDTTVRLTTLVAAAEAISPNRGPATSAAEVAEPIPPARF